MDNRRENLRIVTNRENSQNRHDKKSTKFPGVFWSKWHKKWKAQIQIGGKDHHLGYFKDEKIAGVVYQRACAWIIGDGFIEPSRAEPGRLRKEGE